MHHRIQNKIIRYLACALGISGVIALLVFAQIKLFRYAVEAWQQPWHSVHWLVAIIFSVFMAYSEGYKGFQRGFSPRVVKRAQFLLTYCTPTLFIIAPFFCMSYCYASKKRLWVSWLLSLAIILFILSFKLIPQPWRGILDIGVIIGLSWGIISLIVFSYQVFIRGHSIDIDPEIRLQGKAPTLNLNDYDTQS